jgi:hypothetical protein
MKQEKCGSTCFDEGVFDVPICSSAAAGLRRRLPCVRILSLLPQLLVEMVVPLPGLCTYHSATTVDKIRTTIKPVSSELYSVRETFCSATSKM